MKIESLRNWPRVNALDWATLANEAEKFLLDSSNPLEERLEAGRILNETQGVDEDFTEKDLREYGGISGPTAEQEAKKRRIHQVVGKFTRTGLV